MLKTCSKCHEIKLIDAFNNDSKTTDGKKTQCKECTRAYNREYMRSYNEPYKSSPKGRAMQTLSHTREKRRKVEKLLRHPIKDTLTSHQVAMVQAEDTCCYCGHPVEYGKMTVDHVRAFRNGGTNEYTNLIPSCKRCNVRKSDRPVLEFLRKYSTPLQTRRVIERLATRRGIGYFDMWSQLNDEVIAEHTAETQSG